MLPASLAPIIAQCRTLIAEQVLRDYWSQARLERALDALNQLERNWPPRSMHAFAVLEGIAADLEPIDGTMLRSHLESLRVWLLDHSD